MTCALAGRMGRKSLRGVAAFFALAAGLALSGCGGGYNLAATPNLFLPGDENPFVDVVPEFQSNLVEMIYVTDRKSEGNDDGIEKYGYQRSHSLAVGTCTVSIGHEVSWPDLVHASRTKRRSMKLPLEVVATQELVRFPNTATPAILEDGRWVDPPEMVESRKTAAAVSQSLLSDYLARTERKELFVYVHGYNNSFDEAAFRMAQLWHYMGRVGVPIIYTWPAGHPGPLRGYTHDRESGEFTMFHLRQFLKAIAATPEVEKIHLIAHSRGTDVVTSALRELHLEYSGAGLSTRDELKLGHLVLAAPDIDWEVAQQRLTAERLGAIPEHFTIYLSADDRAIGLAAWLFDSIRRIGDLLVSDLSRAQQAALLSNDQMEVINVKVKTSFVGHGYFIANPNVLSDLILVLRDHRPPGAEHGRPLIRGKGGFWELREGYPWGGKHAAIKGDAPSEN